MTKRSGLALLLMFGGVGAASVLASGCSSDDSSSGGGGTGGSTAGGAGKGGSAPGGSSGSGTAGHGGTAVGGSAAVGGSGGATAGSGGATAGSGGATTAGTGGAAAGSGGATAGTGGTAGTAGRGGTGGAAEGGGAGDFGDAGSGGDGPGNPCGPALSKPTVPSAIHVTADAVLVAAYAAAGVQTYTCEVTGAGQAATYAWSAASVPTATLYGTNCQIAATHYAGPRWKANDGSTILGTKKYSAPSATAASIPQLLLSAVADGGSGILSGVTAVQRLDTVGGIAPSTGCDAAHVSGTVAVPYTATYYFYSGAGIIP